MLDKNIDKTDKAGKKIVLPGEHIASCEEFIAGKNTSVEEDNIFSALCGEVDKYGRMVEVTNKHKTFVQITEGMDAYCIVTQTSPTKAFLLCTPILKDKERSYPNFEAVLPISSIRRGYVENINSEIRIGDVLKARVTKKEKSSVDVGTSEQGYGVVKAFCSRCRNNMIINGDTLICNHCERTETRKLISTVENTERRREYRQGDNYGSKYNKFK